MSDNNEQTELLAHAAASIETAVHDGLSKIWGRENAAAVIEAFLNGDAAFVVSRSSIEVAARRPDDDGDTGGGPGAPPAPGFYL